MRTKLPASLVVLVTQLFGNPEACITVLLHKLHEVIAFDEADLTSFERLRRKLVGLAVNAGTDAQHFASLGNLWD